MNLKKCVVVASFISWYLLILGFSITESFCEPYNFHTWHTETIRRWVEQPEWLKDPAIRKYYLARPKLYQQHIPIKNKWLDCFEIWTFSMIVLGIFPYMIWKIRKEAK